LDRGYFPLGESIQSRGPQLRVYSLAKSLGVLAELSRRLHLATGSQLAFGKSGGIKQQLHPLEI
jgi:hypothetical protein